MFPGTAPVEFNLPQPPKPRAPWLRHMLETLGLCFCDERDFLERSLINMGATRAQRTSEEAQAAAAEIQELRQAVQELRQANDALGAALAELRGQAGPSPEALALSLRPGVIGWSSGHWVPGDVQLRLFSCEVGMAGQGYTQALRLAQASRHVTDPVHLSRAELCVEVDTRPHDGLVLVLDALQARVPLCPLDALDWQQVGGNAGFCYAARVDITDQLAAVGGAWSAHHMMLLLGIARKEGHIRVTISGARKQLRMHREANRRGR